MKQHDINNDFCRQDKSDEALYQQMLAELAPGAEEYDKLISEGKHPAAKVHRTIPYYKYAAAACVLFAVVGGTWFWQTRNEAEPQTQLVAKIEDEHQDPSNEYYKVQVQEEPLSTSPTMLADTLKQVIRGRHHVPQTPTVTQTALLAEDTSRTSIDASKKELYYALLAEVEARETQIEQQKQEALRALINELIYNIEQQPNRPELSL